MALEANLKAAPHLQRGAACYAAADLVGAQEAFAQAHQSQPELTIALFNLGVVCRDLEQNEAARVWFQKALATGEINADSCNNLGILASRDEQYEEAVSWFRKAIEARNPFPLARFNLGTLLLRLGHYQEGFQEYEWRWQTPGFTPLNCPQPQWDGSQFDGTLLVHTEQGIGDVFQFARFIPEIRKRCHRVLFVRPEAMACMFDDERWGDEIRSPGEIPLNAFQATLPLMSAPHVLSFDMAQLPLHENYLTPADRSMDLNSFHTSERKVGFAWCGSPTHVNDAFRSMPLQSFSKLFEIPGISFYSLQIGHRVSELAQWTHLDSVHDLSGQQSDFADTAAIARKLDLIISVDTSVLHLGGAMGIPTWGLLSRRSDWRWLDHDHTETDWYPSVRLYRQKTLNGWDEVIQRVSNDLKKLAIAE